MKKIIFAAGLTCAGLFGCHDTKVVTLNEIPDPQNQEKVSDLTNDFNSAYTEKIHLYDNDAPLTPEETKFILWLVRNANPITTEEAKIEAAADAVVGFDAWSTMDLAKPQIPGALNNITMDKKIITEAMNRNVPKKDLVVVRLDVDTVDKGTQKEIRQYFKNLGFKSVIILKAPSGSVEKNK